MRLLAILRRQERLRRNVVRTEHTRISFGYLDANPEALLASRLRLAHPPLPFSFPARLGGLSAHAGGWGEKFASIDEAAVRKTSCSFILAEFAQQFPLDVVYVHPYAIFGAMALLRPFTIVEPGFGGKVDRLGAVVTQIKAGMIPIWKSDDEFSLVMNQSINADVELRLQERGGDEVGLMT